MALQQSIRIAVTILVYAFAVVLGGSVLVPDPTDPLLVVPVLGGGVLIVHALWTTHLDELGYAILWLWAAVLAMSVGAVVVETAVVTGELPPIASVPTARVVGTLGLTAVLTAVYLLLVGNDDSDTGPSHTT